MHGKKVYTSKSMYSIQGLRTVSNSLPKGLKKILKKGWSQLQHDNRKLVKFSRKKNFRRLLS